VREAEDGQQAVQSWASGSRSCLGGYGHADLDVRSDAADQSRAGRPERAGSLP
jgi:hypothetical protein